MTGLKLPIDPFVSRHSVFSVGSVATIVGIGSIASVISVGSISSLASVGSIASVGSVGSIASVGKVGAILNIPVAEKLVTWAGNRLARRLKTDTDKRDSPAARP